MTSEAQVLIEAKDLTKVYGNNPALRGISFEVSRGEVVGFLGPNGAGKTTTMRILTGFLRPTSGRALVGGTDVAEDPLTTRTRIGYLPENAPLYDEMMVVDYLHFIADMRGVAPDVQRSRLPELARRCGLMDVLGKDVRQLSKGYRQRVGLAQAMVHDPEVLVLDEPTSGLDPNQIVEIRELIKELGKEKTVILSTHILPEVQATCGRVIIISDGRLVADDTPEGLAAAEHGAVIRVVVKGKNGARPDESRVTSLLAGVPGVREVNRGAEDDEGLLSFNLATQGEADPREGIFHAAVDNELVLLDLHREKTSLEDTFRRLTRGA